MLTVRVQSSQSTLWPDFMLDAIHPCGTKNEASLLSYRPDIDGLRAIAVSLVVFYHFNIAPFHGGFVGVDVFFVISGYLITRILDAEIANDTYSVAKFYARRVRRIFPALLVMIICVCSLYAISEFPNDVAATSQSAISAVLFYSNIRFFLSTDYFNAKTAIDPLLHTWSLGVEEQFYIIFPLILYFLRRKARHIRIIVLFSLFVSSLLASIWMVRNDQTAAFYLLPFRAWELITGALIAERFIPTATSMVSRSIEAAIGITLIVASNVFLTPVSHFPGIAALAPCTGTAMLIHAGISRPTPVHRLLSVMPVRVIGLLSYSLYLWHWPLYVMYVNHFHRPTGIESCLLAFVCLAISAISYWTIERPFRTLRANGSHRPVLLGGMAAIVFSCAIAIGASLVSAVLNPVMADVKSVLAFSNYDPYASMRIGKCFLTSRNDDFKLYDSNECLHIEPTKTNVLLLGDSHAAELLPGFEKNYPKINFLQATASGCKPSMNATGEIRCIKVMDMAFHRFLPSHRMNVVVLSALWSSDDLQDAQKTAEYIAQYADAVFVLGPTPRFDQPLPDLLANSIKQRSTNLPYEHLLDEPLRADAAFQNAAWPERVHYVSTYRALCNPQCQLWADKRTPLYFDSNHLTTNASAMLVEKISPDFGSLMSSTSSAR